MLSTDRTRAGLLLATALLAATADAALPEFEASYELKRGGLPVGNTMLTLSREADGRYRYESHSWPLSWVSWIRRDRLQESSLGFLDKSGVRPLEYNYERSGSGRERKALLLFDWDNMRVENQVNDSRWSMDITAGTLDKLTSQLGMILALHRGETDVTFDVADGGRLKEYRYRVLEEETLEVPAGTFTSLKIARLRENSQYETYIWCAPALEYIPVRIWQSAPDGTEYQSDLESFSESLRGRE